jgi:Cof subfamily protein (haloacid dehalogenase superfamily)
LGEVSILSRKLTGIVLDLDGTSLRSDHSVSTAMKRLAYDLSSNGIWLTVASARPPRSVRSLAAALLSQGPWIALNGALALSADGEFVWRQSLPNRVVDMIRDYALNSAGVSVNLYSGFDWIVSSRDPRVNVEARIVGFQPTQVGINPTDHIVADKILMIVEDGQETRICNDLATVTSDIAVLVSKPGYIEVTHKDATKGNALSIVAKHTGMDLRNVLVAGDGENDISMFSVCGWSLAMMHSPEPVKSAAHQVIGTNDDDSLPAAIRSLLLAKRALPG